MNTAPDNFLDELLFTSREFLNFDPVVLSKSLIYSQFFPPIECYKSDTQADDEF